MNLKSRKHYDGISIDEMDYLRDDIAAIDNLIDNIVTKVVLLNWCAICGIIIVLFLLYTIK